MRNENLHGTQGIDGKGKNAEVSDYLQGRNVGVFDHREG